MNIMKLAFANIRKRKGAAVTFLIMTLLAGFMLSAGLSLTIGSADFYETKVDELNAPHYRNDISAAYYKDEFLTYAESDERVAEVSVIDTVGGTGSINRGAETVTENSVLLLHRASDAAQNSFFYPAVIDPMDQKPADGILLGLKFKSQGVRSGDKITLVIASKHYGFTVYGFCEDPLYGYSTNSVTVAYLYDGGYQQIADDGSFMTLKSLLVRLDDPTQAKEFSDDFTAASGLQDGESFLSANFSGGKADSMMFVSVISVVALLFSLILLLIAFIVAAFSIASGIAEDIATIGALKSIGYKNKFLRAGQTVQRAARRREPSQL